MILLIETEEEEEERSSSHYIMDRYILNVGHNGKLDLVGISKYSIKFYTHYNRYFTFALIKIERKD